MSQPRFRPGFRLSMIDIAVLVCGAIAAVAFWPETGWMGFIIAFVIGHFFLFCNVFLIARPLELAWSAVFVVLAAGTILTETPGWPVTIAVSLSATVMVILIAMRRPSYHGICWQWINPALSVWWQAHIAKAVPMPHEDENLS